MFRQLRSGPKQEVLSALLKGSGSNVLMVGGRDAQSPLKIVLTLRPLFRAATLADDHEGRSVELANAAEQRKPDLLPAPYARRTDDANCSKPVRKRRASARPEEIHAGDFATSETD